MSASYSVIWLDSGYAAADPHCDVSIVLTSCYMLCCSCPTYACQWTHVSRIKCVSWHWVAFVGWLKYVATCTAMWLTTCSPALLHHRWLTPGTGPAASRCSTRCVDLLLLLSEPLSTYWLFSNTKCWSCCALLHIFACYCIRDNFRVDIKMGYSVSGWNTVSDTEFQWQETYLQHVYNRHPR